LREVGHGPGLAVAIEVVAAIDGFGGTYVEAHALVPNSRSAFRKTCSGSFSLIKAAALLKSHVGMAVSGASGVERHRAETSAHTYSKNMRI
jgi:hypothetical protein